MAVPLPPADQSKELTELPYHLPGRIYRSPMPFGHYDPGGRVWPAFQAKNVAVVVLLAPEDECRWASGRNLREMYAQAGLEVMYLPIQDLDIPSLPQLRACVELVYQAAQKGKNIAIHCHAGLGRTGLFAACLARRVLNMDGEAALEWVRSAIPGAVETEEQVTLLAEF